YLGAGVRIPSLGARVVAVGCAGVAALLIVSGYGRPAADGSIVFLNAGFALGLVVLAAIAAIWHGTRRFAAGSELGRVLALGAATALVIGGWALATADVARFLIAAADTGEDRWRAVMILSLVWGAYAIGLPRL